MDWRALTDFSPVATPGSTPFGGPPIDGAVLAPPCSPCEIQITSPTIAAAAAIKTDFERQGAFGAPTTVPVTEVSNRRKTLIPRSGILSLRPREPTVKFRPVLRFAS